MSPEALAAIRGHRWPGNVRELENTLERAVVLSADGVIRADAFETAGTSGAASSHPTAILPSRLQDAVAAAERAAIQEALRTASGNRAAAAKLLGISQRNLFYKLKKLGLE
jgi:DNA-binding NtrC family response regulator